ncbi:AMP-binding protein [Nocardioides insulae]|uniref:AMP-binding protein n=1 Tax=Nocardioides insulae TaxID=394734 RepID=UPI000423AF44|nr:AMP-binding protein [Nocardioides insulae]
MLLGHVIENTALRHPDHPAIISGETTLSYSQLAERVRRAAAGLAGIAAAGDRIAVLAHNRHEVIELQYGVPTAGMGCVFVNHRLSPREIRYILADSGATAIAVSAEFEALVSDLLPDLPDLRTVIALDGPSEKSAGAMTYQELLDAGQGTSAAPDVAPDDLAWLVYTSGTTGRPKGAMLSHANLLAAVANSLSGAPSEPFGRFINPFPLCHIAAYAVTTHFANKSTVVLMRAFEAEEYLRTIQDLRITHSSIAPAMLGLILSRPELDGYDVSSLTHIAYGASSISPDLLRRSMARFANASFVQAFGMTELAGNVAWMNHDWHLRGLEDPDLLSAAGLAAPFAGVRIGDQDGESVPNGTVGEILVRADQAMLGYWRNESATREAFVDGWLRTGDLGRMTDQGLLYVVDRKKDMILTGGLNVYSREVEDVLAEHPDIVEAAVVGIPEEIWGESVCAVVVPRPGAELTETDVIAFVKANLASYKKPKYVRFVDALPRNPTGKVLKRDLRETYQHVAEHNTGAETGMGAR